MYVCMLRLALTVGDFWRWLILFSFCFRVYNTNEYSVPLHYTSNIAISPCKRKCVIYGFYAKSFKIGSYVYCLVPVLPHRRVSIRPWKLDWKLIMSGGQSVSTFQISPLLRSLGFSSAQPEEHYMIPSG